MDLITTHLNADFDGLASMVAARKLYPGALLVLPGGAQDAVRGFLALHDLGIIKLKDLNQSLVTRLVMVDAQEGERLGPLKALCDNPRVEVHIFDHHPKETGDRPAPGQVAPPRTGLRVIESVGATTTILIEKLQKAEVRITPFDATVLALGVYEETGSLAFGSTTSRDAEAVAFLLNAGADLTTVTETLRRPLDPDQVALLNDLLQSGETYYLEGRKLFLAASTYDRYHGDLAEVVHKLAEMRGYDVVVAAIVMDDKVEVIGRSRREEFDMGRLMQELGGGGHPAAAAASVRGMPIVEVRERLVYWLTNQRRPTLLARDVMTSPAKTTGAEATIFHVERSMTTGGVNVLPVLDGQDRYLGVITRENVQKALFHKLGKSLVQEFVQSDVYTADPTTPFLDIEAQMLERNQRFVPILSGQKVIGLITRTDLLRTLHDDVLAAARARAKGELPPDHRRRNVRNMILERLPARASILLEVAGRLADEMGVAAYVVGGFVRDLLLNIKNGDIDLVVEGDGIAFAQGLAKQVGGTVTVHERFGTAIVVVEEGVKLDVATARSEYYEYPTALPTVEQSSIKKDLYRRDFTINTMAIRLNAGRFGELVDFYGGQRDVKEKTIRVLHSLSFVEDPTRVFRAIRFEQRFGFRLSKETLALLKGAVKMELFHRLSGERLLQELTALFSEPEPTRAIARLGELDLLRFIHPTLRQGSLLEALIKGVEDGVKWYRLLYLDRPLEAWLVYLMALMEVIPAKAVGETLKRLAVPERPAEKIRSGREASNGVLRRLLKHPAPTQAERYRCLAGLPDETLLLILAKSKSEQVKREISHYLTTTQHVRTILTGDDLKAMGLRPGPQFKKILDRLLDARLNGEVETEVDEQELVRHLARL